MADEEQLQVEEVDHPMTAKPLLVGESNPYGGECEFALWPDPPGCAGWRLCHLVMRLEEREYLRAYDRVNLCAGPWRIAQARHAAAAIADSPVPVIVVLGAKVCAAFGLAFEPFTRVSVLPSVAGDGSARCLVILPHPSGLSRAWGERGAYRRARAVLREAGCLVAPEIAEP